MGWLQGALTVVKYIGKAIPIVEAILPAVGAGSVKAALVTAGAAAVGEVALPGVDLRDPEIAAALSQKIAADVNLLNVLQKHGAGTVALQAASAMVSSDVAMQGAADAAGS